MKVKEMTIHSYGHTPKLTKEMYEDFINRLSWCNDPDYGHCTSSPIFNVQCQVLVHGMEEEFSDGFVWVDHEDGDEMSEQDVIYHLEDLDIKDYNLEDEEIYGSDGNLLFYKGYYKEDWKHINCHLTIEAAENFILRKKHDYGKMRVWIGSQFWCPEFKSIIDAMLNGSLVMKED